MKFIQEGQWTVSTPIYAGTREALEAAQKCSHQSWREVIRSVERGILLVTEKCNDCQAATRAKYRPATDQEEGDCK